MTDQTRKAEQFRGLHIPGTPLVLFKYLGCRQRQGRRHERCEGNRYG
jgi:hypothetical protein